MSETVSFSAIQEFLSFPFRKEYQSRLLIGVGLTAFSFVIPFLPLIFVYGYLVQVLRRLIQGDAPTLPPWEDWGQIALDGLKFLGITLVYTLPGMVVGLVGMGTYFIWPFFIPALERSGNDLLIIIIVFGSMIALFLALALSILLLGLGTFPLPMALAHFAKRGEFGAVFRLREIFGLIRRNLGAYSLAWIIVLGVGMLFYLIFSVTYLSIVLCCFTPVINGVLSFYMLTVAAALFGRVYYESAL